MRANLIATGKDQPGGLAAIATAGLIVGTLDITSAFILGGLKGASPIRILQFVASGLLGRSAYQGGLAVAGLGLLIHFFIAFSVVIFFYAASRSLRFLTDHAVISGLGYGVAVYLFMNLVVLPLSAMKPKYSASGIVIQMLIHMFIIGLLTALIVRRFRRVSVSPDSANLAHD